MAAASSGKRKNKRNRSSQDNLLIEQANGWTEVSSREQKTLERFAADYRRFISEVKTEREANDRGIELATAAGFRDLAADIAAGRRLKPGEGAYLSSAGKTLLLFRCGRRPLVDGMRLVGGHTDSPRLDLKPRPLYEDGGMALLDTHYYGGVKKYQWVTIPLAIHGVVARKDGSVVSIVIGEDPDDPVLTISDLLPHLGKDQATKRMADGITGEGLNVLCGSKEDKDGNGGVKGQIMRVLHERYGIDEWDLTSAELEIVPAGPARDLGFDRSMLLGYGHDDRVSAYTALRAILDQKRAPTYTSVVVLCDKEEIGSVGATGMNSQLFENAIAELVHLQVDDAPELTLRRCLRNSKLLSADVNALHDPNYPEVSSPNENMARMNRGVVLTKYCGARGKSGSNDASAEFVAEVRGIFDKASVRWQTGELGKVDQGGGGTIAHMMSRYEMDVIDCGVGVLSMHAPMEVASKFDIYMAYKGYTAFLQAK
jgi:aspartyl aminopeptidase